MILKLASLLALAAQGGAPAVQQPTSQAPAAANEAAALISKAMLRYYQAPSLAGKIRLTQSAQGVSIVADTEIQYDRPSLLYIRQSRNGSSPRNVTIVSDGKKFAYDRPEETLGPGRFTEYVTQNGYQQTIGDMYGASVKSVVHRSPVLDMAIGRRADLEIVRSHWGSKRVSGRKTVRGISGIVVDGNYHEMPGADPTGTFQMVLTEEGDILEYRQTQRFRVPDQVKDTIEVVSQWEVDLKVGAKTDPGRYRL
jgi:hypothetical protein